jgi:SNF2 family DNA or RNA helicase
MIELNPHRFRTRPFAHQLVGVRALLANPAFALFDEMGVGKSKQVIDAACALYEAEEIDAVVVVAPASVRSVWLDAELGEIAKHSWVASDVAEFHQRGLRRLWRRGGLGAAHPLAWIVTNYAFIRNLRKARDAGLFGRRRPDKLSELLRALGDRRFLLVLDESSYIKNRTTAQARACYLLRQRAARVVLLNGTPIANSPLDLWAQFRVLDERALPFRNFYAFRARYAVMGGWQGKVPIGWQNLDELQRRLQPYVLRREKRDCLDLPPKLYTTLEVPLTPSSWKLYKEMRDEAVAWLDKTPVLAGLAIVKILRLSQITSGFLGGLKEGEEDEEVALPPREIGREKLVALVDWIDELLATGRERDFRLLIWCRFRAELKRAAARLAAKLIDTRTILGGQTPRQRAEAIRWFQEPLGKGDRARRVLVAQPQAGGFGLNLAACHRVVYLSNDFNLLTRLQSEDRVHRPGQDRNVTYLDVLATGPSGGRTIDATILRALRKKEEVARWTTDAWRRALLDEDS